MINNLRIPLNQEPTDVMINLDLWPNGNGINFVEFTCNERKFKFSKEDVFKLLEHLEKENNRK